MTIFRAQTTGGGKVFADFTTLDSGSSSGSTGNDAVKARLVVLGYIQPLNEAMFYYLRSKGRTGVLNDMLKQDMDVNGLVSYRQWLIALVDGTLS